MPFIALDHLWHRKLTGRDALALLLLLVALTSFASVYIAYRHSQDALKIAVDSRNRLRADRIHTEFQLCGAANQGREINNRDRDTLIRARAATIHDLHVVKDPIILSILRKSLAETEREIAIRPVLKLIDCNRLIDHKPLGDSY